MRPRLAPTRWRWRKRPWSTLRKTFDKPNIDYASLAKSYGAVGIGPITDPKDLGDALKKGVAAVKAGEPVLLDVVMQPRG